MRSILFPILVALSACQTLPDPQPTPVPTPVKDPCAMVSEKQALQFHEKDGSRGNYELQMPATGSVAHEAHYLVEGMDPKVVPSGTHLITPHMARTCTQLLRGKWAKNYPGLSTGCLEVYKGGGATQWTPAEGGGIGHGSTGRLFPSLDCEAMIGTQYWARGSAPKPGTRYIAKANGKAAVICMGYEAGPGSRKRIGGLGTEALYYLGGKHGATVTLGKAVDQTLPYGPVECAK